MVDDTAAGRGTGPRDAADRRREVLVMARLGLPLDLVARRVGLGAETVSRLVTGTPATARAWERMRGTSAQVLARAGLEPDHAIARTLGLSRHRVQRIRRAAGVPAWRPWPAPHGTYARWQVCVCRACGDARVRHDALTYPAPAAVVPARAAAGS